MLQALRIDLPNGTSLENIFEGSVDFGEKIFISNVEKIDFIELFEENKEVFEKALLDKNEEYGFFIEQN